VLLLAVWDIEHAKTVTFLTSYPSTHCLSWNSSVNFCTCVLFVILFVYVRLHILPSTGRSESRCWLCKGGPCFRHFWDECLPHKSSYNGKSSLQIGDIFILLVIGTIPFFRPISVCIMPHVTQHIDNRCCSVVLVPTDFPCTFYFSLCQPFWKVLQEGSSRGRSVVGIFTHMVSNCNLYYLCYFFLGWQVS
jgi:hypothetical protein